MATNSTRATPAEVHSAATRHRESADEIDGRERAARSEVDGLVAVQKGDLINKLNAMQDEWSENVKKVTAKLREMAGWLDDAGNTIAAQDSDSGGSLR